jgi:hypothetical protein
MIAPPVDAAWKAACVGIDKIEKPTEEKIRAAVSPLFEAIKKMKEKVQAKFEEKVVPVIATLMAPVSEKLIPKICLPFIKAQKDLIEEFVKHHGDESRGSWHLYWDLRKRENEYDVALEVARLLLDEWELYNLPSNIMDSCFSLLEAARYNYHHVDGKKLGVTCAKLLHDCLIEQHRILTWLVELLVLKPFNEKFGAVLDELCGPLDELVPDVVKEFLAPSDVIKDMASNAMASAIQAVITAGDQSTVPEKMIGYFKDHGVTVETGQLDSMKKQASSEKKDYTGPAPLERQGSAVPKEAVDSDSEPESTAHATTTAHTETTYTTTTATTTTSA